MRDSTPLRYRLHCPALKFICATTIFSASYRPSVCWNRFWVAQSLVRRDYQIDG
jgi:hypothetical protein